MAHKQTKSTGLGADAFFTAPASSTSITGASDSSTLRSVPEPSQASVAEKSERRSFNLRLSVLRQLEEIQIKTIREGKKQTLSSIVERGIEQVAKDMGIDAQNSR